MSATKHFGFLMLATLAILAFYCTPTMACSCMPAHPQTHYCNANYVIVVRVLRKSTTLVPEHTAYKVEIKRSYKMTPEGHKALRHGRLITATNDGMCGVHLQLGKLYVIAGRSAQLVFCDYIKLYQNMSIIERKGLSGMYRKGCNCGIKTCFGSSCQRYTESGLGCKWSAFAECETAFSACMPVKYNTPEGTISKCRWRRTPLYDQCMATKF